jgi:hypothetical protein
MLKPIHGTMKECWRHYAATLPMNDKNVVEYRRPIMDFVKVQQHTIRIWMNAVTLSDEEAQFPVGEPLIRLRYFLDMLGYKVQELEALPAITRVTGALAAYDVVTFEQLRQELVYEKMSTLYQCLHGVSNFSPDRAEFAQALVDKHSAELAKRTRAWKERMGVAQSSRVETPVSNVPANNRLSKTPAGDNPVVVILSHLIQASTPLMAQLLSDDVSSDDRRRLRELVGEKAFFDYYIQAGKLCSEAARKGEFQGRPVHQSTSH